ncbi:Aste57867_371 [Aphanomyces stellatus]|uniref:Carboxypeptidase n=1 Tax=Aphanomyces stellatus TaxID=120398 RepID=A0A485K3L7_9STRA|nr:hypothetical protein As57867_000370 [Aphanomyces stellatus]VFT77596.1 Aste57867_371 [Aphanomyces stellatus]
MQVLLAVASLALAALTATATSKSDHQIPSLPGYNDAKPINFDQYAGYIPLPSNGQKMFYWLTESESNPSTDPLVLWLNGGPGCSSISGFFTELGPFVVQSDLTVKRNPYAWNRKANVVFLESPAGVGFSQPLLNATEYTDDITAARAAEFLQQFLEMHPRFKGRDFYIAGESYAGMYVPFLVHHLVTKPVAALALTGFAVGNAYTDQKIDDASYMDYFYSHGLISIESYRRIQTTCKPTELWLCQNGYKGCSDACAAAYDDTNMEMSADMMNPYYIYGDICFLQSNQTKLLKYRTSATSKAVPVGPCADVFTSQYLNLAHVQEAIHVTRPGSSSTIDWTDCSNAVGERYHSSLTVLDKYPTILKAGLKALVYSGDADSVVNFIGTQRWLTTDGLNLTVTDKWHAWYGPDKQLAGYKETYGNVTFKTVKGAGHMVPATRPLQGLYMFECFLYGSEACQGFVYPKTRADYVSGATLGDGIGAVNPNTALWWWTAIGASVVVGVVVCVYVMRKKTAKKTQYVELTASKSPTYAT